MIHGPPAKSHQLKNLSSITGITTYTCPTLLLAATGLAATSIGARTPPTAITTIDLGGALVR